MDLKYFTFRGDFVQRSVVRSRVRSLPDNFIQGIGNGNMIAGIGGGYYLDMELFGDCPGEFIINLPEGAKTTYKRRTLEFRLANRLYRVSNLP